MFTSVRVEHPQNKKNQRRCQQQDGEVHDVAQTDRKSEQAAAFMQLHTYATLDLDRSPATRNVVAELPSYLLRHMVGTARLNNLDES